MSRTSIDERKTVLKTIRIPESLVRSLEEGAHEDGMTVNAYINSIISRHFGWDKKVREFGITEIPKSMLKNLVEGCNDETLARIGREAYAEWKEMTEFFLGDSSPRSVLDFLTTRSRFGPDNQTRITQEEDTYIIVMRHDSGPKWSIILKNAVEEGVKQLFHVEPRISAGESVVTARFKVNPRKLAT